MDYDIIATLGPASDTENTWQAMLQAGATAFRLNTSHLTPPQLADWLGRLRTFRAAVDPPHLLILDLQGSKWRLGDFPTMEVVTGQQITLTLAAESQDSRTLPVPHTDFFQAARVSAKEISLNDAKLQLMIESMAADSMTATVTRGGIISSRKGITYLFSDFRQERLSQKDQQIVADTRHLDSIRYALSYVRDAAEMGKYRAALGPTAFLIAKLERQPAVDQAMEVANFADELWLCRGDLGAELGTRAMAETAAVFSDRVATLPAPTLLAGQVLEHMTEHPAPTRSEITCIFESLRKGYAGVVLSDETAVGLNPVQACQAAAVFRN